MRTEFRVPCTTGTYADTLTALGLAKLLFVLGGTGVRIQRQPGSSYYLVTSETPVGDARQAPFQHLFSRIVTKGKPITSSADIDYEAQKATRTRYRMWRDSVKTLKPGELPSEAEPPRPREDFGLISSLVTMLKSSGEDSYEKTARLLQQQGHFGIYSEAALQLFHDPALAKPGDIDALLRPVAGRVKVEKQITTAQIFTPVSPKGMWAEKPNSVGLKNLKGFIPIEMLKFAGWWHGAIAVVPKLSDDPKKNEDLKVLVVSPEDIPFSTLQLVMSDLYHSFFYGPVQVDILAALRLTEVLLQYHDLIPSRRGRPRNVIAGFSTAYFKSLGNARGLVNLSFISLPDWVEVVDNADRQLWLEVLREHRSTLSRLDESHSEARSLLKQYRDFLSLGLLEHFLEFLVGYGTYALGLADKGQPVQWFTTTLLRRVFMGLENETGNLSEILENTGFQNIAKAIRLSTRGALYARKPPKIKGQPSKQPDRTYEVRYGLAQELKRKARYPKEFLSALNDFVQDYLAENYRAHEREKPARFTVSTDDLLKVTRLVDKYGSEVVGMMLVAFGYAREPYEAKEDQADDHAENDSTLEGDE